MTAIPAHMYGTARQFGPLPDASTKRGPYAGLQYHEVYRGVIPLSVASQFDIRTDGIGTMECAKFRRRFGLRHLSFLIGSLAISIFDWLVKTHTGTPIYLSQLSDSICSFSATRVDSIFTHDDESPSTLPMLFPENLLLFCQSVWTVISSLTISLLSVLSSWITAFWALPDAVEHLRYCSLFKRHGYSPARARLSEPSFIARCLRSFKALKLADITCEIARSPYQTALCV